MSNLADKIILLLFSVILYVYANDVASIIIPLGVCVSLSCINEFLDSRPLRCVVFAAYSVLCAFFPQLLFFLPLMCYDLVSQPELAMAGMPFVILLVNFSQLGVIAFIAILLTATAGVPMKLNTLRRERLLRENLKSRDDLAQITQELKESLTQLKSEQDKQVSTAMLGERNRIAREIHDNVGHLLSSAILQLGAIRAVSKDEATREALKTLQATLDEGMNSIRSSVHDLRDNSIDLNLQLDNIVKEFTYCNIKLSYNIDNQPPVKAVYAIIAIVKEALNNVIRHSDATEVDITLYEHPKLYQVIISDNGTASHKSSDGMGLDSIRQRVEDLDGIVNFFTENGFRIFISFRKQDNA